MSIPKTATMAALVILTLALGAPSDQAQAEVPTGTPTFSDPLDIDNTYSPFVEHRIKIYELTTGDGDLTVLDVFLPDTRTFSWNGDDVECACLQEWEVEDGEIVEISLNYFAQADDGTKYYFGEVVDIYEDGAIVSHDGSWLVGGPEGDDPEETLDADDPAVFMPGNPEKGDVWKPEDLPDFDLEEFVKAMQFQDNVDVEWDSYDDVLKVKEKTPAIEFKWYAPDVGFVKLRENVDLVELVELIDNADEDAMNDALDDILDALLDA